MSKAHIKGCAFINLMLQLVQILQPVETHNWTQFGQNADSVQNKVSIKY